MQKLKEREKKAEPALVGEDAAVPPSPVPPPELVELEETIYRYVTSPDPPDPEELAEVLVGVDDEDREERLGVYRVGYLARLINALKNDYPHASKFLEPAFPKIVDLYVRHHPSSFYNITRMRDGFVEFLSRVTGVNHLGFAVDLARVDRTIGEVGDAPETVAGHLGDWEQVADRDWNHLKIFMLPASRLLSLKHPVDLYMSSPDPEPEPEWLVRNDSWLVLYRYDYRVFRINLDRREYALLRLLRKGLPLGQAIRMTSGGNQAVEAALAPAIPRWFEARIFEKVEEI